MSISIDARRAAFKALIENYYNDLSCEGEDVVKHPVRFLTKAMAAGCLESAVEVDPRMTSTAFGAAAVVVARKVMENAKAARAFIDIEIAGQKAPVLVVSFDRSVQEAIAQSLLAETGKVALLCKPDDKIASGLVSDMLLYLLEPAQATVSEGVQQVNIALMDEATAPFIAADAVEEAKRKKAARVPACMAGTAPGISTTSAQAADAAGSPGTAAATASVGGSTAGSTSEAVVATVLVRKHEKLKHDLEGHAKEHGAHISANWGSKSVHKFGDASKAAKFHKSVKSLGYETHVLHHEAAPVETSPAVVEAAVALHAHVFGADALAHLEESARGAAALAHMMKVYGPLGAFTTVKEADPFRAVLAKAKQLHESKTSYEDLVDEAALALDDGDVVEAARLTVADPAEDLGVLRKTVSEDLQSRASLLQSIARYALISEGLVPDHLRVSFEAFVSHIKKAVTHPAS